MKREERIADAAMACGIAAMKGTKSGPEAIAAVACALATLCETFGIDIDAAHEVLDIWAAAERPVMQ